MPYEHIPGVGATYLDGAFRTLISSNQPRILVLGPAASGVSNSIFAVNNIADAESEFGSDSELMKPLHEAVEQGADNIAVMRIGGRRGRLIITDDDTPAGRLEIYPERRDDDALDRYNLIIEDLGANDGNRYIVYDNEREIFVYDSEEELVLDTGLVEVNGDISRCDLGDVANPAAAPTLGFDQANNGAALEALIDAGFVNAMISSTIGANGQQSGADGADMTPMERYAALEHGYQFLDYEDADMLIPVTVHIDDPNQEDEGNGSANMDFSVHLNANELPTGLGYLWKYLYRGKPYCVFFEAADPFTAVADGGIAYDDGDLSTATMGGEWTIQPQNGMADLGSVFRLSIVDGGAGADISEVLDADQGRIRLTVTADLGALNSTDLAVACSALPIFPVMFNVTGSLGGGSAAVTDQDMDGGGQWAARVILSDLLDGEALPTAVLVRLLEAENAEVRHVNFGQQLAYACARASTTWTTMLGFISTSEPSAYSRAAIAEWVGQEPDYSFTGTDLSVADNASEGEGLLGHMLHAGMYDYRSHKIATGAVADEGYAYGGYIQTSGDSLPTDEPYGINADDEALDLKGEPIDLGKHILVCASWPILSNSFDGGSQYRGSLCGTLAGKIAITPEKEEPIGINGVVRGIRRPPRMRTPLINSLAKLRFVTTRREEGLGHILVSVKTAAHPDSDYTRLSTIRSVNREISGIRDICKPYIGKEFSSTRLASLQTAINGFLKAEKEAGFNQGALASLSYTRADKIMGRLTVKLKMIPPFSIEAITIETTLAAEESELT